MGTIGGNGADDSDSDSEDALDAKLARMSNNDAASILSGNWGKKKHYWSGDTADLEIGQDMQDALDEEEGAKELEYNRLKNMRVEDFGSGSSSESDSESDEDVDDKKGNNKSLQRSGKLSSVALGQTMVRVLFSFI